MANGNIAITAGGTIGTIAASGSGISFLDPLYKYANLTLPFSPNDPGLQYTYDNSSLAPTVFLYARFFNLLNEPSNGILINVGTSVFPSGAFVGDCIDVRSKGAVGDGVKDDTAAIQAALDEAAVNASGKVNQVSKGLRILQSNTGQVSSSDSTQFTGNTGNMTIPLTKPTTKGTLLFLGFDAFHWDNPPVVSDSAGNPYTQFISQVDGEHITYGYYTVNSTGGAVTAIVAETGAHGNSFIIGSFLEIQSLVSPIALDGTPASNAAPPGGPTFNTGTLSLTNANALDTAISFLYTEGSTFPNTVPPVGYNVVNRDSLLAAGGAQEIVVVYQDIAISGSSQNLGALWKIDSSNVGAVGFTVAFKAAPLTTTVAFTGPTTVCIPFGVNCLVSYQSIDMCDGIWYSHARRCLTMDNGVTLNIDGSIIKAKEDLFLPVLYVDPPSTIGFGARLDGQRTYVLNGFDSSGNPATETYVVGTSTVNGTVVWSALTGGTVTPPFNYPQGPSDIEPPDLGFQTGINNVGDISMLVVGGQIKFGNATWPITKQSNFTIQPPSQVYFYNSFGDPFTATITLTGQDQNGNDVTDVITITAATSGTSNVTFSKIYAGMCQTTAGNSTVQMFYYPPFAQSNHSLNEIGFFDIQQGVGHVATSGLFALGMFPGGGFIVENVNAFAPFSQFNFNITATEKAVWYKSVGITGDYTVDIPAAHTYEGSRNTGITLTGSGQVILNGDWAYRNADQNFGRFALGAGIPSVGFARLCACDNSVVENLEIISPCRAAVSFLHSDNPTISNLYIHDGHGDDQGFGIPFDGEQPTPVDGVINLDFCRNARVVLNRLNNNEWGGIADWDSFQSLIQQNDMDGGRYGYQFVSFTQEFQWDFFETGDAGLSPVNNEISGNRATMMTQPSPPPNNLSPTETNSAGFGWGFGFFDDGGPGEYLAAHGVGDGASGISFHDNVANSNVADFLAAKDIIFRSLYNNSFSSGGTTIINGLQQVSNEIPSGTIDGINDTFTLAHTPSPGTLTLTANGLLQDGTDYTLSGNTITFLAGHIPPVNTQLLASYSFSG
jgi:hypothetical protein